MLHPRYDLGGQQGLSPFAQNNNQLFNLLGNGLQKSQQAFDSSFANTLDAQDKFSQFKTDSLETPYKNKLLNKFSEDINSIVQDKYNGDWGAASKEIAKTTIKIKQSPFWQEANNASEIRKNYIQQRDRLGTNFLSSYNPLEQSIVDQSGNINPLSNPQVLDKRQIVQEFLNLKGAEGKQRGETDKKIKRITDPVTGKEVPIIESTTTFGLTDNEIERKYFPGTKNAREVSSHIYNNSPELQNFLEAMAPGDKESQLNYLEQLNYQTAKENLVGGFSNESSLLPEGYLNPKKKEESSQDKLYNTSSRVTLADLNPEESTLKSKGITKGGGFFTTLANTNKINSQRTKILTQRGFKYTDTVDYKKELGKLYKPNYSKEGAENYYAELEKQVEYLLGKEEFKKLDNEQKFKEVNDFYKTFEYKPIDLGGEVQFDLKKQEEYNKLYFNEENKGTLFADELEFILPGIGSMDYNKVLEKFPRDKYDLSITSKLSVNNPIAPSTYQITALYTGKEADRDKRGNNKEETTAHFYMKGAKSEQIGIENFKHEFHKQVNYDPSGKIDVKGVLGELPIHIEGRRKGLVEPYQIEGTVTVLDGNNKKILNLEQEYEGKKVYPSTSEQVMQFISNNYKYLYSE